jgi:cytochrome c-type biogenesis protein CcmH
MLFWPIFALMTGAAVFAVLWPLARARSTAPAGEADFAVYRDQLGEIARDRARGIIGVPEAEAARIEISRRLIGAGDRVADAIAPGAERRRRMAAIIALAGIPLVAFVLYGFVGSPGLPDAPLQARPRGRSGERARQDIAAPGPERRARGRSRRGADRRRGRRRQCRSARRL